MKFEKINENKLRIIVHSYDLIEKNIDYHSFMANPIESQTFFLDVLAKAEQEIGFETKNHKIAIDAVATSERRFYTYYN